MVQAQNATLHINHHTAPLPVSVPPEDVVVSAGNLAVKDLIAEKGLGNCQYIWLHSRQKGNEIKPPVDYAPGIEHHTPQT